MTKTILVPLDGSDTAERALPVASWLRAELGAELHLLMTSFDADVIPDEQYLSAQAASCGADRVRTEVLRKVFPTRGIVETLAALPYAVLCLTTHGRGALGEMLLGSVSDEVLRSSTTPTVLVGPACEPSTFPTSKEVVVAVDGSPGCLTVLPTVSEWAQHLDLAVHLVTVEAAGTTGRAMDPDLNESLDQAAAVLGDAGVQVERHVLLSNHPADVIVTFAAARHAAFVAMGSHGAGGLAASALGRVTTHVVRHASCPVLTQRSRS
jgi:nucleotide-binding universal stress UspA family protein